MQSSGRAGRRWSRVAVSALCAAAAAGLAYAAPPSPPATAPAADREPSQSADQTAQNATDQSARRAIEPSAPGANDPTGRGVADQLSGNPARVARGAPATRPAPGAAPNHKPDGSPEAVVTRFAPGPTTRPTSGPATVPGSRPATHPAKRISLNFKDAPLDAVLDHLSEAAGLVIVKEGPVDGRVTVESKQPVSPEEAVALLSTVLKANNYTAVQNGRIVRVMPRDKAKKGSIPVHVGADPADIANTEELITQVIPLSNIDAAKLRQDLTPLLSTDADVTANESTNSIIMTDSSANIRRIAQIIAALDKGTSAATELRVVHLKFANATATAKLITSIFHAEASGGGAAAQQQQQMRMAMGPGQPQPQPGGGGPREGRFPGSAIDQALHGAHVGAEADERTNTLILTAPAETLKIIDGIIKELDSNPVPESVLKAFRLNYADAESTAKLLTNLFKPSQDNNDFPFFNPFRNFGETASKIKVNVTFDQRTNSVLVSAPAEAIAAIEAVIKDLDSSPGTGLEIRTFTLKYADAFSAAKMITSVFEGDKNDQNSNPFRFFYYGGQQPSTTKGVKVTATSDDRTNTLIVTGPKEAMKVVEGLVKQLDANTTSEETLFLYHLRNGQAVNLELVLNTLFGNTQQGQNNGNQPNQNGQNQNQQNGIGRSVFNNNEGSSGSNGSNGIGTGRRNNRNNGQNGRQNSQRTPAGVAPALSELTGQVFVVADPDTNTLIVTTATRYKEQVQQIIAELDRPAPQVLIKVLVAEVTHENAADFGVDFSILDQRASGRGLVAGQTLGNAASYAANGGLAVSLMETNLNATLHLLATQGKLDVLSRPYILASDNQEATITVGQEVPYITDTRFDPLGGQINNVILKDIGIILDVTPHINPEGLVILDVDQEISQLTAQTVPIGAGVSSPVIAKRAAQSRVGIRNGETIVIGGLMEDRKTDTVSKIPLLGDIPFIGSLFSRTQTDKTKTELLIFLTPHVAQQPEALNGMSQDEMKGTRLTPHAVAPGVFEEHMYGLHRGAVPTSQPTDPAATQPVKSIDPAPAK